MGHSGWNVKGYAGRHGQGKIRLSSGANRVASSTEFQDVSVGLRLELSTVKKARLTSALTYCESLIVSQANMRIENLPKEVLIRVLKQLDCMTLLKCKRVRMQFRIFSSKLIGRAALTVHP